MQCKYVCFLRLLFIWFLIFLLSWVVFYATAFQVLLCFNPLNANPTKWSNTLKQFLAKLPTNCLSVFDHFVKLALKGLRFVLCVHLHNSQNSFILSWIFWLRMWGTAKKLPRYDCFLCAFAYMFFTSVTILLRYVYKQNTIKLTWKWFLIY